MGGKASAELANLYCYAVESQFIDQLVQEGKLEEAKSWFHTWRYIDDLLGFGDRKDGWQKIDYGMEHIETTDVSYSEKDHKSQAVFLGMRIQSDPAGFGCLCNPKEMAGHGCPDVSLNTAHATPITPNGTCSKDFLSEH